jgi:hypothetical protein
MKRFSSCHDPFDDKDDTEKKVPVPSQAVSRKIAAARLTFDVGRKSCYRDRLPRDTVNR